MVWSVDVLISYTPKHYLYNFRCQEILTSIVFPERILITTLPDGTHPINHQKIAMSKPNNIDSKKLT